MNFKDKLELLLSQLKLLIQKLHLCATEVVLQNLEGYKNEVKFHKSLQPLQSS